MATREKIDILVMRGTGRVARYHLATGWLRALWITPLCLALLVAGSLIVLHREHTENAMLRQRLDAMLHEHDSLGERLVRLENIEKILRSKDRTELETLLAAANPENPGWWKGPADKKDEAREKTGSRPDLSRLLTKVDVNQAGVDNLKASIENRRLHLGFDLSNLSPQSALTGRGEVSLIGNDATLYPLKSGNDDLSFQIQRFKQIATNLNLPAKCDPKDVYGIKLTMVDPSGKTIFSQVYPLSK